MQQLSQHTTAGRCTDKSSLTSSLAHKQRGVLIVQFLHTSTVQNSFSQPQGRLISCQKKARAALETSNSLLLGKPEVGALWMKPKRQPTPSPSQTLCKALAWRGLGTQVLSDHSQDLLCCSQLLAIPTCRVHVSTNSRASLPVEQNSRAVSMIVLSSKAEAHYAAPISGQS